MFNDVNAEQKVPVWAGYVSIRDSSRCEHASADTARVDVPSLGHDAVMVRFVCWSRDCTSPAMRASVVANYIKPRSYRVHRTNAMNTNLLHIS